MNGYEVVYDPLGFESTPDWPFKVKVFDLTPFKRKPNDEDKLSLIIKVGSGRNSFLFTGDAHGEAIDRLLKVVPSLEPFVDELGTRKPDANKVVRRLMACVEGTEVVTREMSEEYWSVFDSIVHDNTIPKWIVDSLRSSQDIFRVQVENREGRMTRSSSSEASSSSSSSSSADPERMVLEMKCMVKAIRDAKDYLSSTVITVPHHASMTNRSPEFVSMFSAMDEPKLFVVSSNPAEKGRLPRTSMLRLVSDHFPIPRHRFLSCREREDDKFELIYVMTTKPILETCMPSQGALVFRVINDELYFLNPDNDEEWIPFPPRR